MSSSTRVRTSAASICLRMSTTLLCVADHCLKSTNYINVIVSDKQKHLQYMTMDAGDRALHQGNQHLAEGEQR